MKRIWIGLLLAAGLLLAEQDGRTAQDGKKADTAPKKPQVQRLFILKYADPMQLMDLLRVFDAQVRQSAEMHALAIEASPEAMRAIEDAIQKLDVPSAMPKNVDMTIFLLVATDGAAPAGGPIPKDLDSVATQLRAAFPFKDYGLLDILTFRTRTGQPINTTSSGGTLQVGNMAVPVVSTVRINSVSVGADGSTVRIDKMSSKFQWKGQELDITSDVDVKEGQKVVVGRLGISHDQALFLVIVAKVL